MQIRVALLCAIPLFVVFGSATASAELILSFSPSSPSPLFAGSSGTIDVLIHSNSDDVLDAFQLEFTLTPMGISPAGGLKFSTTQLDAQLTDPDYVFAGRSLSQHTGSSVGTVNFAGDVFTGYDATDDVNDPEHLTPLPVTLTTTDLLLFRLNLDAVAAGNYQISITSATFLENYFDDENDGISFTAGNGMITVSDATAAVPEPSTAVILGLTSAFGLVCRRKKCRPTDGLREI